MNCERILMDIEVQHDFFAPGGSCYRRSASETARRIYRLFRWARKNDVPVISTLLRVRKGDLGPLAGRPHCVDGTEGEQKLLRTVLPRRVNLGLRQTTDLPVELFGRYQQVIFEKRQTDILLHPAAERLLTEIEDATFVLCGAGVAKGIVEAAVGLRERGFGVILAQDAVLHLGDPGAPMAYRRMDAKGVIFAPTSKIVETVPHGRLRPARPARLHSARRGAGC
jgi:nicotinamidase-related amidase